MVYLKEMKLFLLDDFYTFKKSKISFNKGTISLSLFNKIQNWIVDSFRRSKSFYNMEFLFLNDIPQSLYVIKCKYENKVSVGGGLRIKKTSNDQESLSSFFLSFIPRCFFADPQIPVVIFFKRWIRLLSFRFFALLYLSCTFFIHLSCCLFPGFLFL